jgi:hypothetical protein
MLLFISILVIIFLIYKLKKQKPKDCECHGTAQVLHDCHVITFTTKYGFEFTAKWIDCETGEMKSKYIEMGSELTVCAKTGSATGGPMEIGNIC